MKRFFCILLLSFLAANAFTQNQQNFGIKFSGFVKADYFFDSRQTVSIREGHFLLYPEAESLDINGKDINAKANLNMLTIQTRLKGSISGPDAFGAKTSGVIEGAFFGHSEGDINGFRLRHAYLNLKWKKAEILFGQSWHPMFIASCFPAVVSFNTGAPFQPFSRNPQVKFTRHIKNFKLVAAVASQRDFTSTGPDGKSSKYLRNSVIPDVNLQLHFNKKNKETGNILAYGIGGEYKVLSPRLINDSLIKAEESVKSMAGMAFLKIKRKKITYKLEAIYGQNLYDLTMLGGYAIKHFIVPTELNDYNLEYTPITTLSVWTEIHSNGDKWVYGLFAGYTKNMGSLKNIYEWPNPASYYSRGFNIDYIYRLSPRIMLKSGKSMFATEVEYTVASYGTEWNSLNEIQNGEDVANIRLLFSVYYFF
ncbi:hypothetical protein ACFL6I_16585 [candidate division KSB1 bacterium]